MTAAPGPATAGFTLIEVLIALVLFALISVAGISLIDTILGVQQRTDKRLERLADIQRAMFVMTLDLEQLAAGPLAIEDGVLIFRRSDAARPGGLGIRYDLADGTVQRHVSGIDGERTQALLGQVAALRWAVHRPGGGWQDGAFSGTDGAPVRADAIAVTMTLAAEGGDPPAEVRRLVALPAEP